MHRKQSAAWSVTLVLFLSSFGNAEEPPGYTVQPPPELLRHFLQLEGEWVGTHVNHEGKEEQLTLVYRNVSGGTAVEERIFANTPKEMITMYHGNGDDRVLMTHYCALGNQPRLQLEESDGKHFAFSYLDGVGIDRETTGHMGRMKMTVVDENTIRQEWAYYEGGKEINVTQMTFKRAQQ